MAYQSRQPCVPPPIVGQQGLTEAQKTCPGLSSTYQTKQPCIPPALCTQPSSTETPRACVPASAAPCPVLYEEAPSVACASSTLQPCLPLPANALPCPEAVEACAAPYVNLHSANCPEAVRRDAVLSYVMPGSVVCLNPCGSVTVKPGPVDDGGNGGSVFLESCTSHFP